MNVVESIVDNAWKVARLPVGLILSLEVIVVVLLTRWAWFNTESLLGSDEVYRHITVSILWAATLREGFCKLYHIINHSMWRFHWDTIVKHVQISESFGTIVLVGFLIGFRADVMC